MIGAYGPGRWVLRMQASAWLVFVAGASWSAQPASEAAWTKCMASAQDSREAAQVQKRSGVAGLNEWLVERCGPRPAAAGAGARQRLRASDCDKVYELAQAGSCDRAEYSMYQEQLFDQLDNKIFREDRFKAMCEKMRETQVSRKQFALGVCEAPH